MEMGLSSTHTLCFFFLQQKTEYKMRISDWSSDVCSSDLHGNIGRGRELGHRAFFRMPNDHGVDIAAHDTAGVINGFALGHGRKGKAGGVANRSAQSAERRPEAYARTCTGLEEQIEIGRASYRERGVRTGETGGSTYH